MHNPCVDGYGRRVVTALGPAAQLTPPALLKLARSTITWAGVCPVDSHYRAEPAVGGRRGLHLEPAVLRAAVLTANRPRPTTRAAFRGAARRAVALRTQTYGIRRQSTPKSNNFPVPLVCAIDIPPA